MKKIRKLFFVCVLCLTSLISLFMFAKAYSKVNAASIPSGQALDTVVDTISVADLTFSGLTNQTMIGENKNTDATFTFSAGNTNKNLVFKFKYDVVDDTVSDSNAIRIHLDVADDKWDVQNSLWIRGNGTFFRRYQGSSFNYKELPALTKGLHEIEYGRIALLESGNPTGNYYVYYKLDGVEVRSDINPYDVSKMDGSMFINFSSGNTANKVYDANLSYEAPQYVSISDLKKNGSYVGNSILDKDVAYNYDISNQPTNKSTVFFANVDYKAAEGSQIYILGNDADNWDTTGYVWFQSDKTYFGLTKEDGTKNGNKEIKYATALTAGTQHTIEYGRLAVMNGDTFQNRYHIYFKLDGVVIYGIDQSITSSVAAGGKIHITGSSGFDYLDAYTLEDAKNISVSDLKNNGTLIGNSLDITGQFNLTYDNTDHTPNYSIKAKFKYTAKELKQNQFHFTNTANKWNSASSIILNNDTGTKVNFGKSTTATANVGYHNVSFATTQDKTYVVEFGRLARLVNGVFSGTYYNYLKIDDEIVKYDYFGIPQDVVEGNVVFITADGKNTIEDAYGFEDAKTISVSDLKDGTNSVGSRVRINGQSLLTYDNIDHKENYSLVFKFKYEATELKQNQFHLTNSDNKWKTASSFILNNDSGKKVHLGKSTKDTSQVGWYDIGYVMTSGGVYDVEYGRIALTFNGKFSGKYYVYLKINDTIVKEDRMGIPQEVVEGNVVFVTADGKNLIADKDYGMPTYETADEESISNLKINGNSFGSFAILDQSKKLSYDAVADHKSVVYKFNYEVKDPSTVGCQFHFSDDYSENSGHYAGMVWFRNDKTYLRIGNGQYINTGAAFTSAGTYAVELGKKYITAGNEVGKYYVYVKVDGTLLLEYFVEDMPDKAYLFTTAKDGTKLYDINYVDPVFETADEISVGDLKYMNDNSVDTRVLLNEQVKYKYTATAEHKSVKFKFQYAVNNAETINCQFHFTDGWLADNHGGMVWFKNDNNLISMVGGGYLKTASFEAAKVYIVEISKLYITSGSDAGNYYISLSVNDVVVLEYIVPDMPDKANIFMTGTNGDVIYDKDYDIDIYEVADQISIGDLKPANAPSAKVITLDQIRSYSYEATTGYKSVVFKFAYEVSDPSTVDCQFHFSDRYSEITKHYAGMIWFRSDKTYLRTANGKYITKDPVFKSAGTYAVELGKVYVTVGKNSGKYYIYIKIADAIVMDCFAEDMPDVAGMFMTGTNGDRLYDVTYAPCTSAHTLTKVDAKAETCTENGHIEYYHCSECGKMFSDADGKNEITDIVILKHHTLVHVNAKAETCTENGNIEHFHCTVCGKNYSDDAAKKSLDNVVINAHHTLTKVDAKAETCTEDGNVEYYHCTVCGKNFSDANGTSELKDITVKAHHTLTKVEAKMPTRTEDGNIEHYHCTVCGKNFNDSNASEEIANIAVSYDSSKESLDGTIKSISVADLTIDGVTNQSMIVKNQNTEVTFNFADSYTNKSLVFKFKYDVVDDNKSDSNAIRIHFDVADDKWNSDNSLWIRGDAVYLAVYKNSKYDWSKKAALTLGVHEIEFGRVAVLYNGNPTGEYYVYYKVDGVEINSSVNPYNVSKMGGSMFINFSSGNTTNKVYDANLSYEAPQYVSISDLKDAGSKIQDKGATYEYDLSNQPTNKSTVFFANVDYKTAEDSQIYITTSSENWNTAGYIWFQPSKTYFGITKEDGTFASNKEVKYATALTAGTQHSIEYGRLAVMKGDVFQNRYHVYFKLDGVIIYGIDQPIVSSVANAGRIHITGNGGFDYLDAYSLEDAKVIGVKDLKKNDTAIGDSLKIIEQNNLTYDNDDHKANYSLVVKFKYVAIELKQNQFHFTSSAKKWDSASSIILNNDGGKKVHLGKSTLTESQVGWHDTAFTMTAGTTYVVEYGRLARMAVGSFTGKYYTYLKIDGEIIKEDYFGIPQEVVEGNVVFITADGKNEIIDTSASETPGEETLDTNIRTISVADLTIDGLTNQSMVAKNQNQEVTFDFADSYTNKSLVFKFKYDVTDDNKADSNAIRIHFDVADDKWNSDNSLWIRGDAVYLAVYNNSKYDWSKKAALTLGVHEIEFGRVAILNNGNPTGNYYVYYKVDGVEINSSVNPYNVSKMGGSMFINFSSGNTANKVYDANLSYEAPQYVSISDLKDAGSKIQDKGATYEYDLSNQPTNKSTVFFAKVDYKVAEDSQIYITTSSENWNTAGYVWFQPSKTYFGITKEDGTFASNKEIKYATALTAGTQHTIEYGRLAVMSGDTFLNRYHVYFKLDGVIIYGIDQPIVSSVAAAGKIHITGNGGFDYIDGYDLEEAKEIGVKDLKKDGAAIGDSLKITEQNNLTYDNDNHKANYSIVVKFKYTAKELKQNQFHFTNSGNKWNSASSIILNNDSGKKVHLGKSTLTESQVGWYDISFTMTENTTYAIEFGRLARLANGEFTGKYYTYLKIDGEIIKGEYFEIPQEVVEGNVVFVTADGHNEIMSEDATPEEPTAYETADEISVSDLKKNDAAIGSTIILNEHQKFSYDATAAKKSVIFRFKYEVLTPENIDCQFHFTDGWLGDKHGGIIWLRYDKNRISKAGGGYVETNTFAGVGVYEVEIGKLYITAGPNTGKYYIYLTVSGTKVLEYIIDEMPDKAAIFMTGKNGDKIYDKDYNTNEKPEYETPDEISIGNLSVGGNPVGKVVVLNEHHKYTYNGTAQHSSVVFKFLYEVADPTTVSCQIHFTDGWLGDKHGGIIWFRDDKNRISKAGGGYLETAPFTEARAYEVEIGKLYITAGPDTGKYYIYLTVDGTKVLEYVIDEMPVKTAVFTTGTNGDKLYDISYAPDSYETADEISIGDLKKNGNPVGNAIALNENSAYSYEATATHKSVIFKFNYEVTDTSEVSCQFHFSNRYSEDTKHYAGMVWFRPDKTYMRIGEGQYINTEAAFASAGTYTVELGKLYVTAGENVGKFYIYVKVNDKLLLECVANEMPDKANIFTTGTNGDVLFDIDYVDCNGSHTLVKIERKEATCTEEGVIEHWYCTNCGKKFSNAEGTTEITEVSIPKHHTLTKVEAVAATCTEDGSIEHYHCSVCGKNFSDAEGTSEITSIVAPKHHTLERVEAVAPTCTEDGSIAYYHCSVCGKNFSDAEGTNEITDIVDPKHHTLTKVDAVAGTCTAAGNIEHYHCGVCGKNFSDAEGVNEITDIVDPVHHTLSHREAVVPTCTEDGNIEYYHCSECGKNFSDAEGTTQVTNVIIAAHHTLTKVEAKAATCTEAGNIEYYHCSECGKNYSDAEGTIEVAEVTIEPTGHHYDKKGKCTVCGEKDPNFKGCKSSVAVGAFMCLAGLAVLVIRKKREER